jgi:hypothetical protein
VDFLKALLTPAKDTVAAEKEADEKAPAPEDADRGKASLTALFEAVRTKKTPDHRCPGGGRHRRDREAAPVRRLAAVHGRRAGRKASPPEGPAVLQAPHRPELFDRAYGYIKQYY